MLVDKIKKLYEIVGEEKFLEIVDAIPGHVYIPRRQSIVRETLVKNADMFLEEVNKSDSKQEAAKKFNVSERTINNWVRIAISSKVRGECVKDGSKLARAVL